MWKSIKGFDNKYFVNESGEIMSSFPGKKSRILKPISKSYGYQKVNLQKGSCISQVSIHRVVAEAFLPNPEGKKQVNHKNGNKHDNRVENLEWVTPSENTRHSFAVLGKKSPNLGKRGKKNPLSRAVCQYDLQGYYVGAWNSISDAARFYACNPCQIINNIKGRTKTCHGFMWRYEKAERIDDEPVKSRITHKRTGLANYAPPRND